jgi:photosystem II stability/assembly factor-like uncharacterized protein
VVAKNRFPGKVLLPAALLLASCSDGGGDGVHETYPPATPAAWRSLQRTPTSANLRGVRFVNGAQGWVVGDATSIFRTDNADATVESDVRWFQHEPQPTTRQADLVSTDIIGGSSQAVGNDATGGKWYASKGARDWDTDANPGSGSPYTEVDVVTANEYGDYPVSFLLRQNGTIDNKGISGAVGASGVSDAQGIDYLGTSGTGYVCGGDGAIHRCNSFGARAYDGSNSSATTDWFKMPYEPTTLGTTLVGKTLRSIQIVNGVAPTLAPGSPPTVINVAVQTGFSVGDQGTMLVLHEISTGPTSTELRWKQQALPVATTLHAVHFPSDFRRGWAVGADGTILRFDWIPPADPMNPPNPVEFSYTVSNQSLPTLLDLFDVWFVNSTTGFAVGESGLVLRTTNAGATWSIVTGGVLNHFNALDFDSTGTVGVAVADGTAVLRTTDGGSNWIFHATGLAAGNYTSVSVPKVGGTNMAFICGDGGRIYRCADIVAGTNWEQCGGVIPPTVLRSIHFGAGPATGVCVGSDPNGGGAGDAAVVFQTINGDAVTGGAVTWTPALGIPDDASLFSATSDIGGLNYYVGGATTAGAGAVYTASVGGLGSWTAVTVPAAWSSGTVRSLQAPYPPGSLFAAVDGGGAAVWRLLGGSWSVATPAAAGTPVSVSFPDPSNGYVVIQGMNAGIHRTINGGTTWTLQATHTKHPLRFVWASPSPSYPDLAFACGESGTILKTTTGGD